MFSSAPSPPPQQQQRPRRQPTPHPSKNKGMSERSQRLVELARTRRASGEAGPLVAKNRKELQPSDGGDIWLATAKELSVVPTKKAETPVNIQPPKMPQPPPPQEDPRIKQIQDELLKTKEVHAEIQSRITKRDEKITTLRELVRDAQAQLLRKRRSAQATERYKSLVRVLDHCVKERNDMQAHMDQMEERDKALRRTLHRVKKMIEEERAQYARAVTEMQKQVDDARRHIAERNGRRRLKRLGSVYELSDQPLMVEGRSVHVRG